MKNKDIVIMGGTFNPIHNGHINAAQTVKTELCADKVLFIPSGMPPHKDIDNSQVHKSDRFNMTRLAIEDIKDFEISDIEINKDKKCYTIDTLDYISKQYSPKKITLIVGTDMFLSFEKWKDYDKILEISNLAVVARFSDNIECLYKKKSTFLSEQQQKIKIIDKKVIQISSTKIRDMISKGQDTKEFLSPKVESYIKLNKLYTV